ncbi:CDP-alcohol phosphatidyltransferase family protein [Sulfobacillus harzensis]|uniref:Phosphatidylglycerophosphate synthase n=1 Tax=Sulfobacillus harzensis TaxID=2729629 RepID=A0A7Y0Q108_9FIRM|nr:CDP-alcohol phosphatidyltransferase family protein [Sulfobacillus harzensis]
MIKLADWFTLSRVIFTPLVAVMWALPALVWHWWGLGLFVVAGLTDFADGRIARARNETGKFGSYVDPLADKILVLGTAAVLISDHRLSVWWFFIVLMRELAVTTLRSVLKPGASMPASRLAKWKTITQLFAIGASSVLTGPIPEVLVVLSGILTVVTGYEYIRGYWPSIEI